MEIIIESIRKILLENRVDDVRKKFPNVNPEFIDYFVKNDPSGNQKYLEWLVKAVNHKPTVMSLNRDILGIRDTEPTIETVNELWFLVNQFHNLLPYLVRTNEEGKKEGTTDLYQYKFTDTEMIHYLAYDLRRAEDFRNRKEKEKKLKSEADKLYEDSQWLVIRPKTWESSCHYGAGTKWCTTSKETSSHFKRETDRNFLIYVIDKNRDGNDMYSKVAWQIPYKKNFKINDSGIKLWNVVDTNIANSKYGENYLTNIVPEKIKSTITRYINHKMDEMYKNVGYSDDPKIQALVEHLQIPQDRIEDIELLDYTNYGMTIYLYDDNGYTVADDGEIDAAKENWAQDFITMNGVNEALNFVGNPSDYYYIKNQRFLAQDLADSYIKDLTDEEILEMAMEFEEGMVEEYNMLLTTKDDLNHQLLDLEKSFGGEEISKNEYDKEVSQLEMEKKEVIKDINNYFEKIKKTVFNMFFERYIDEMQTPVEWLKDWGWWENGKPHPKAIENDILGIDEDALVRDLGDGLDVEYFSRNGDYWRVDIGGTFYWIIPTDV